MTTRNDIQERLARMQALLKEKGYRMTPQRLAILRVLAESRGHPSVDMIHAAIRKDFPTTSLATVYKTVQLLKEQNEVLELEFSDLGNRYDGNRPYPHPHVICTGCGAIMDPVEANMRPLAQRIEELTGFKILTHRLDFYGQCAKCQRSEK